MLSKFSIKKPFTILVAVVIVIVFGVIALTKMTPDLFENQHAVCDRHDHVSGSESGGGGVGDH